MALTEKYVSATAPGGGTGLSAASPWTFTEMVTAINAGTEVGSRMNIYGTFSRTGNDTITGNGTSTSPIILRGCSSGASIGDGYLGRTNGNGPLITTNMPPITYASTFRLNITGTFTIVESLNLSGSVSNVVLSIGADSVCLRTKVVNTMNNANASALSASGARDMTFDCDLDCTGAASTAAVTVAAAASTLIGCRAKVVSTASVVLCNNSSRILFNTIYTGGGPGISMNNTGGTPLIGWNTVAGNAGDGIDIVTGTTPLQHIIGNMSTDNGGFGVDLNSAAVASFLGYNRYRDNTSGNINSGTDWASATNYGAVISGGGTSDYVSAGSPNFNYNLVSTSPARQANLPLYAAIGALQPQSSGSTGLIGRLVDSNNLVA